MLKFIDSIDLIKRVFQLRLVLCPEFFEELGYDSAAEMYGILHMTPINEANDLEDDTQDEDTEITCPVSESLQDEYLTVPF